jgi:hypothetical protein
MDRRALERLGCARRSPDAPRRDLYRGYRTTDRQSVLRRETVSIGRQLSNTVDNQSRAVSARKTPGRHAPARNEERGITLLRIKSRAATWIALFLIAPVLAGCGSGKPKAPSARLEGTVKLDGAPIAKGTINFIPQGSKQAQPDSAPIIDGRYAAQAVPLGKVLVMIRASKETGKMISIPDSKEQYADVVEIIPQKYAQGIPIEVSGDKPTWDFDLTSK